MRPYRTIKTNITNQNCPISLSNRKENTKNNQNTLPTASVPFNIQTHGSHLKNKLLFLNHKNS